MTDEELWRTMKASFAEMATAAEASVATKAMGAMQVGQYVLNSYAARTTE